MTNDQWSVVSQQPIRVTVADVQERLGPKPIGQGAAEAGWDAAFTSLERWAVTFAALTFTGLAVW